jgi:enamine deaminase RidA (YjgF/YER057c/UK114 family)
MQALLSAHGGSIDNLARVTGYVNDAGTEREAVYDAWDVLFPRTDAKPAFKILDAALPEGTLFRLDFLARLGHTRTRIDIDNVDARDPCVRIGDWLLTSRLHGTSPETGETVPGGLEPEARQALANGLRLVELAGGTKADVTQICGFGVDLSYVDTLRRIVDETFAGQACQPSFQAVQTFVRPVLAVMVEVTAVIGSGA